MSRTGRPSCARSSSSSLRHGRRVRRTPRPEPRQQCFLLGPDLLIAQSPYPDELDNYTITLPPAGWYDY